MSVNENEFRQQMFDYAKTAIAEGKDRETVILDLVHKNVPVQMAEDIVADVIQFRQQIWGVAKSALFEGKNREAATLDLVHKGVPVQVAEGIVADAIQFIQQLRSHAESSAASLKNRETIIQDLIQRGAPLQWAESTVTEAIRNNEIQGAKFRAQHEKSMRKDELFIGGIAVLMFILSVALGINLFGALVLWGVIAGVIGFVIRLVKK